MRVERGRTPAGGGGWAGVTEANSSCWRWSTSCRSCRHLRRKQTSFRRFIKHLIIRRSWLVSTDRRPGRCRVEPRRNTGERSQDWRRCWEEVIEHQGHGSGPPHPPLPPSEALSELKENNNTWTLCEWVSSSSSSLVPAHKHFPHYFLICSWTQIFSEELGGNLCDVYSAAPREVFSKHTEAPITDRKWCDQTKGSV